MRAIIEVEVPHESCISSVQDILNRHFDPNWMSEWWHSDDIQSQAEQMGEHLTDEECQAVLNCLRHKSDASIGINWDTIDYWIDQVLKDRIEEVNE